MSPGSRLVRTSATATRSSPPGRSSRSASRGAGMGRWDRGSLRRTRSMIPTTSRSVARLTARPCRMPRTSDLILGVARLVVELSGVLPLLPGDIIFTGTPAGVGFAAHAAAVAATRQRARDVDRGHWHDPQPDRPLRERPETADPRRQVMTWRARARDGASMSSSRPSTNRNTSNSRAGQSDDRRHRCKPNNVGARGIRRSCGQRVRATAR